MLEYKLLAYGGRGDFLDPGGIMFSSFFLLGGFILIEMLIKNNKTRFFCSVIVLFLCSISYLLSALDLV
jgi:hypothetical protein